MKKEKDPKNVKRGKAAKRKGAGGERDFAQWLTLRGYSARRSQQFCGKGPDASDVMCENFKGIHIEVKRTERLSLYKALEQAQTDNKNPDKVSIVAHRANDKPWLIVMDGEEWLRLIQNPHLYVLAAPACVAPEDPSLLS